jgi:hypothetical protein
VIGDDLAPLGSASNPIVIHVDEDWCYDKTDQRSSDTDTEVMATPEFWEALIDESFSVQADERGVAGSSPVYAPTGSLAHKEEGLQSFEQSSQNYLHLDDKSLSSLHVLQNSSGLDATNSEDVGNGHASALGRRLFVAITLTNFRKRAMHGGRQGL